MQKLSFALLVAAPSLLVGFVTGYLVAERPELFAPTWASEQEALDDLQAYAAMGNDGSYSVTQTNTGAWVIINDADRPEPLVYDLTGDTEVIVTPEVTLAAYKTGDERCNELTNIMNVAEGYEYSFTADQTYFEAQGQEPSDFAYRVVVIPNRVGYRDLESAQTDFIACHSDGAANAYPTLVSNNWIAYSMGCEGVMKGCATALESLGSSIGLKD